MYVVWDVKTVSSAGIGPYAFGSCTMALSWRDLFDTEKVITRAWRQCIPSKLHEQIAQEYGVTSQKSVILNYPVGTPHIICNNFNSQQPSQSLSRSSLFLAPNQAVAAWHHRTSPSCPHFISSFTEPNNDLHQNKRRKSGTCHGVRLGDLL